MDRGGSGELIPVVASANRRPGRHAGAWPRRRRRRPPPAAYWREGGDEPGMGRARLRRQVRISQFFFCFSVFNFNLCLIYFFLSFLMFIFYF